MKESYQKNQVLEMEITDLGSDGEGIGRTGAFLWFVKDALPGDRVRASVMKTKKSYGYARLQEVLAPSPDRIAPACPLARACGGCTLQAMDYKAQLKFKENKVRNNLVRIGGLRALADDAGSGAEFSSAEGAGAVFHPAIGMEHPLRYRNKAQFPVGTDKAGKPVAGFYAGRTHSIIPCSDCLLGTEENREILKTVLDWMEEFRVPAYDEASGAGMVRHVLVRKGFRSGQIMVCLVMNGRDVPQAAARRKAEKNRDGRTDRDGRNDQTGKDVLGVLTDRLMKLPGVTTVVQNINRERTNVILGKETLVLAGPGFITDTIGDTEFEISAQSFYQVNPVQTEVLYGTALKYAGLTGKENVWDLYCGIGTISLFMAKQAKKVYGDEIVPQAVEDARRNALRNGIGNAEFFVGKAEEVLPAWYAEQERKPEAERERIDVICVDPPRKGCDEACLNTILKVAPERIVYVSCDSATLARDLKYLLADGRYTLTDVQPVDMFPQTVHVETVCLLSKLSEAKNHISVKVDMDEMDLTAAESKATYQEIKEWVKEKYGFHVSHLNIAKTKRKCGIIERQNYNLPKSEDSRSPETPKEKEEAIIAAFKAFRMI